MCDKCVKREVCKLNQGFDVQGCIEFYRSHEEILKEIRAKIKENSYHIVHGINNHDQGMTVNGIMQIIDEVIKEQEL